MLVTGLVTPTGAGAAGFPDGHYTVSASPSSVVAGSAVDFTVSFLNTSPNSQDLLRHVEVTLPASPGFTGVSLTSVSDTQGGTWSGSASGNTVTADTTGLNLGVSPGGSVNLAIHATAPTAAGTYAGWSSAAVGTIGGLTMTGSYTNDGSNPSTTVTPAVPSKVVFTQQPSNGKIGTAISPAIKAAVTDAYGNVVTTYGTSVSLSTAFNPNTGTATNPSGTLPQSATPVSGIATFSNVVINTAGDGYKLQASSGSLTPATSNPFRVDAFVGACPAGQSCTSPTQSSNGTTAKVTDESGANNDIYTLTLATPAGPQCGQGVSGNQSTFTNQDTTRFLTVTMSLSASKRTAGKNYGICFANKSAFLGKYGMVSTPGSDGFYHGYLASCTTTGNQKPCLVSLTQDSYCNLVAVFRSPPGDPKGMFGFLP
jgi:hypothetical protein